MDLTNIEKILESQYQRFLDTTPLSTATYKRIGIGVEEGNAGVEYNPDIERVKWIIDNSARTNHKSNDKQMSVPQKAYKGDDVFEFVNKARDKMNYKTNVLEVDTWNEVSTGHYKAKLSSATIVVTSYTGEEIDYDIYFNGDPTDGQVTITSGVPSFTATTSL